MQIYLVDICLLLLLIFSSCKNQQEIEKQGKQLTFEQESINSDTNQPPTSNVQTGKTLNQRFYPPPGFKKTEVSDNSFAKYLRNLPLKPPGSKVKYYDGGTKPPGNIYVAVVDMDIGARDLQQCADAIIRLRAEYLYKNNFIEKIHFNFTSGDTAYFSSYANGFRPVFHENDVSWVLKSEPDSSYIAFRNYLFMVYQWAGTYSLDKELLSVKKPENIAIGDVFIKGGFPGHGVIVVDKAINEKTGEVVFLLAQSYMPAQDIQILSNPDHPELSPWYKLLPDEPLITPEWTFNYSQLKRFQEY